MGLFRYVREADADVAERSGDHAQQDVGEAWPAEPALQGNVHVPGRRHTAARSHAHGLRLLQPQHQAQGDDRMVFAR